MAHLVPTDLIAKAKKNPFNKRATRVIDRNITVKVGCTINKKHYEVLEAIHQNGLLPCPKPLHFVELEPPYNAIVMSTIEGETLNFGSGEDVVKSVLLEIKNGMEAIQEHMAKRFPRENDVLGSIAENGCLRFPKMTGYHDQPVTVENFVDTMMSLRPQRSKSAAFHAQRSVLNALVNEGVKFCHMDLNQNNILVKDGRLAGVVDWDAAGWYTEAMDAYSVAYTSSSWGVANFHYAPLFLDIMGFGHSGLYALAAFANGTLSRTAQLEEDALHERNRQAYAERKKLLGEVGPNGAVLKRKKKRPTSNVQDGVGDADTKTGIGANPSEASNIPPEQVGSEGLTVSTDEVSMATEKALQRMAL